jgi:hypothetical protein
MGAYHLGYLNTAYFQHFFAELWEAFFGSEVECCAPVYGAFPQELEPALRKQAKRKGLHSFLSSTVEASLAILVLPGD